MIKNTDRESGRGPFGDGHERIQTYSKEKCVIISVIVCVSYATSTAFFEEDQYTSSFGWVAKDGVF